MGKCLVTGAAGFIGSHLCEALLNRGHEVIGIDCFIPYYSSDIKKKNLYVAKQYDKFKFYEFDLRNYNIDFIRDCDVVFHLAAMPGLVKSWEDIDLYTSCNLIATQRLLEYSKRVHIPHIIYVSTSSVYGREATGNEFSLLAPCSPYGVTKLAAEHLCRAYETNFGMPVITILRYFSVYGPRQRPDMAYNIIIQKLLKDETFVLYGDGNQTRSNTYVSDIVNVTIKAYEYPSNAFGRTFNIGGRDTYSLNQVIEMLENISGKILKIEQKPTRIGDQKHTSANIEKAQRLLNYKPKVDLRFGLINQFNWQKEIL